ncbi:MAG: mechanosensitive ion channel family protein [Candidatus Caldarchaeum sp.]|uniref:Mechanosensitive ion channel family protein n=1 Tax=Caldiarchaeum subterraneum TaxID=311458 RepID=A0A7C5Q552_CALS0
MNLVEVMDVTLVLVRVAVVAGILLATFISARFVGTILRKGLRLVPPLVADQVVRWVSVFIWLVGLLLAVNQLGLNLDILLLLIAVAGVTFAIASKDILSNIVSKYFLGIYIPIKSGDSIQIAGFSGKVVEINQIATLLLDDEGYVVAVPNSVFVKDVCVNKSSLASQRVTIPVSISSKISLPKAEAELLKLVYKYKVHLDQRFPPIFTVKSRGSSQVEAELVLLVARPEIRETLAAELGSKIRERLDDLSREDGK